MGQHWVLMLSDRYAECYHIERGRLLLQQQFAQQPAELEKFSQWLRQTPIKTPLKILVDLREETYQIEQIPHVSIYDRKGLLKHKLQRLFKTEPYSYAEIQGNSNKIIDQNSSELRHSDCALFTALTQQELVKPWIDCLLQQDIAIKSISSLPLLSANVLPSLADYSLVLTPSNTLQGNFHQGVRQLFFKSGRLLFSRLLVLSDEIPLSEYLSHLQAQIEQTLQYLRGARLLTYQDKIQIYLLASTSFLEKIRPDIAPKGTENYHYLSFSDLDISKGLKSSNIQQFYFRHLMVLYVANYRSKNHYASGDERQYFSHWLWRRGLYALASLCFLFALGFAFERYYQSFFLEQDILRLQKQAVEQHNRYLDAQSQQKQLLGLSMEVIHIKNTVDSFNEIERQFSLIDNDLIWLSHYLKDAPALYVDEIRWQIKPIQKHISVKTGLSDFQKRFQEKRKNQNKAPLAQYHAYLNFKGFLKPYDGNSTAALRLINRFINRLRADERIYQINTIELPLSVDPSQSLDGVVAENNQVSEKARFQVEIIFQAITAKVTQTMMQNGDAN